MTLENTSSQRGLLLVLSGPSGVGKDTVWREASHCLPTFAKATTCTTRAPRPGEAEGVAYFFVSDQEFDRLINENLLLEWAFVNGNRYGVPVSSVNARLESGLDVVCVIDVQGALKIRALHDDALLVFLKPPPGREVEVLEKRIAGRGAENEVETARRLETAQWELGQTEKYDYEIVNDEVENAAQQLCEIIAREKQRRAA
jgi:guanylate kinase